MKKRESLKEKKFNKYRNFIQMMGNNVADNNEPVVFDDNLNFSSINNKLDSKYMYENS